jgi:hypothetical protein
MTNSWIEPPPPQKGMGCFGTGCLILLAFFALLALAGFGGTFFAVRFVRSAYFPKTAVTLPHPTSTTEEQQTARAHWESFVKAAHSHAAAHLEMTADELNALAESEPELRGKVFVSIADNVGHLRVSLPMEALLLRGRYLNAECTVQSAVSGRPADARVTSIVLNGVTMGEDVLNWRGPYSYRRFVDDWSDDNDLKTFEIQDGKVILETKGSD